MIIKVQELAYGRSGFMNLEEAECSACHEHAVCITVDTSDGEYGTMAICQKCADSWFGRSAQIAPTPSPTKMYVGTNQVVPQFNGAQRPDALT